MNPPATYDELLAALPCPFCGSTRIVKGERYFAMCVDCGATGPERNSDATARKFTGDWNTRHVLPNEARAALQARLDAAHAREDELAKALERAIQHVPKNAISVSEALSKPISKCRTQDFCELALTRHSAAKEQRNKQ